MTMTIGDSKFNIEALSINELKNLIQKTEQQLKIKEKEQLKRNTAKQAQLIGECFKIYTEPYPGMSPKMWRYYKVIDVPAINEYYISTLCFDEYPFYGCNHAGYHEFTGIMVVNFPFYHDLKGEGYEKLGDRLIKISIAEYNTAMISYINQLQKKNWSTDYYNFNKKINDSD